MSIFSDFLDLVFPPICICCQYRLINGEKFICLSCLNKIPTTDYHNNPRNNLEQFLSGRFPFTNAASYAHFVKEGLIQKLIHELKYRNNPELGLFLGEMCAYSLKDSSFIKSIDFLVPVPIHPKREKIRGYNQSLKIAEGISNKLSIPILSNNLIRIIDNPSQTKQSKNERWLNTENIFDLRDYNVLEGKHILLIDDIITTGSTIESCAKAILKKGEGIEISIYSIGAVFY